MLYVKLKMYASNDSPNKKYKSFHETYSLCAFSLLIGFLYPNKSIKKTRWLVVSLIFLSLVPILFSYIAYIWDCMVNRDIINLVRQVTIGILFALYFFKVYYSLVKSREYGEMLDVISKDLLQANDLDVSYQEVYDKYIKIGKFGERCWLCLVFAMVMIFPVLPGFKMIYNNLLSTGEPRIMIHEMNFKYLENREYDSPYFEIIWMYQLYVCLLMTPCFLGFDGTFCICTAHVALKMKLAVHKLKNAFKYSKDKFILRHEIKSAIKSHQSALNFFDLVHTVHTDWLLIIFGLTSLAISLNLYQVSEGVGIEAKYAILTICCAVHTFTPCYFANILSEVGNEVVDEFYCCDWELWDDPVSTKMVAFILARAQVPLAITAKGFVTYNLQLFVSVIQSSYSFYTILRK